MCIWQLLTRSQGASGKRRDGFQHSVTLTPKTRAEISHVMFSAPLEKTSQKGCCHSAAAVPSSKDSTQTQLVPTWLETLQMRPLHSLSEGWYETLQPAYDVRRWPGGHTCLTKVTKGRTGRGGCEWKWDGRNERAKVIKECESTRRPLCSPPDSHQESVTFHSQKAKLVPQ